MTKEHLNDLYGRLESIRSAICNLLKKRNLDASWGFFNGHFHKDEKGIYRCDAYPFPVISVANICDIEIDLKAGRIDGIVLPGDRGFMKLFGRENNYFVIKWKHVKTIGEDVILVDVPPIID